VKQRHEGRGTRKILRRSIGPREQSQFGQSFLGLGVALTKQDSQTLVPFFSVKSTLRVGSISTLHFPQTSICGSLISSLTHRSALDLSNGLCANSRLKTSNAAIASCIEIRSSLETCPPSEARARIASSAALTRSRSLLRLISKTAARYSCSQLFSIISIPGKRLLTQPCCSLRSLHRSARKSRSGRHN
jgi:hypothetical protein